jgi:hypothetical protein
MITIHNDGNTYTLQPPAFVIEASIQRRRLELARPESWLNFTDMGNPKAPVGRRFQRGINGVLPKDTTAKLV